MSDINAEHEQLAWESNAVGYARHVLWLARESGAPSVADAESLVSIVERLADRIEELHRAARRHESVCMGVRKAVHRVHGWGLDTKKQYSLVRGTDLWVLKRDNEGRPWSLTLHAPGSTVRNVPMGMSDTTATTCANMFVENHYNARTQDVDAGAQTDLPNVAAGTGWIVTSTNPMTWRPHIPVKDEDWSIVMVSAQGGYWLHGDPHGGGPERLIADTFAQAAQDAERIITTERRSRKIDTRSPTPDAPLEEWDAYYGGPDQPDPFEGD